MGHTTMGRMRKKNETEKSTKSTKKPSAKKLPRIKAKPSDPRFRLEVLHIVPKSGRTKVVPVTGELPSIPFVAAFAMWVVPEESDSEESTLDLCSGNRCKIRDTEPLAEAETEEEDSSLLEEEDPPFEEDAPITLHPFEVNDLSQQVELGGLFRRTVRHSIAPGQFRLGINLGTLGEAVPD